MKSNNKYWFRPGPLSTAKAPLFSSGILKTKRRFPSTRYIKCSIRTCSFAYARPNSRNAGNRLDRIELGKLRVLAEELLRLLAMNDLLCGHS